VAVNDAQGGHGDASHLRLSRFHAWQDHSRAWIALKPKADDMRDSPSIPIIARPVQEGTILRVFDGKGMEQASRVRFKVMRLMLSI
jgi:hypothetical protein